MTFSAFNAAIRASVWPDGEAENLVATHKNYVIDALIDLQRKIPRLQTNHTQYIQPNQTFFSCGASFIDAPRGYIVGLYTLVPGDDCCQRIDYKAVSKEEMDCMIQDKEWCVPCGTTTFPYEMYQTYEGGPYIAYPELPYCEFYPTPEIDKTCRATDGWFSLFRGQLWIFPSLQSNEIAILEYDGIKTDWQDADIVDETVYTREVMECVELYLRGRAASVDDCDLQRGIYFNNENPQRPGMFQVRRADLIHSYEKEARLPKRNYCFSCN